MPPRKVGTVSTIVGEVDEEGDEESLTAADCVQRVSRALQQLEEAGLQHSSVPPPTADTVEHILITDKWSCRICGFTELRLCPSTGRPHRRYLVRIAQNILRLIGSRTGRVLVRPPRFSDSMKGGSRLRSKRRVTMNPQALLLAYYYAVLSEGEASQLVVECAQHLLVMLEQLKVTGAREVVGEEYASVLLSSTSLLWHEYSKQMSEDLISSKGDHPTLPQKTLVDGIKDTYLAASRELGRAPANEALEGFRGIMRERLRHMLSSEELKNLEANAQELLQAATEDKYSAVNGDESLAPSKGTGQVFSAQTQAPPILLSEDNTSGSEVDTVLPVVHGPALPPNWYIDEQGRSRPPCETEDQKRREKFARLEFRAKKAYETVIGVPEQRPDPLQRQIAATLGEAQLAVLAEQCNSQPPDLQSVPVFLNAVIDGLLSALPRRFRTRVEQEIRDVLDWRVVRRSVMGSPSNISALARYVMRKVAEYGSPANANDTLELASTISSELESCTPDLGTAVANAFRVMFSSIRKLHESVARYSLLSISQQLRENAVPFMREFIEECLPPVDRWESSLNFIRKRFNDERVKAWASSPAAVSTTVLTEKERRLRGSLLYGLIDLLQSHGVETTDRWHQYPTECFFFDKPVVFFAANAVQEATLLLLLIGTISTVLRARGVNSMCVNRLLKQLHKKFLSLLSQQLTLSYLKASTVSSINEVLSEESNTLPLTDSEIQQLDNAVDKMTDTNSVLYATFEKRIIAFIEALLVNSENDPAPLGLVADSLYRVGSHLQRALLFNWEVYKPVYCKMLAHLTEVENSAC
ncbi:putative T complex protein 11 [Trypanosoma vivax]|nr:putative T complex protein 11 [Trypanosoma vivax]